MTDERVYRFRVRGRVQGVAFRAHTQATARAQGLRGWVANHVDGSVVGKVAGPSGPLEAFRAALAEGPPAARVDQLEWKPCEVALDEPDFDISRDVTE